MLPSLWTVPTDPLLLSGFAATAAVVLTSARRPHRGRGRWRRSLGWIALLLLAIAWVSPLQTLAAHYLLTAHLLQITLVMGVIPPLILLALPDRSPLVLPPVIRRAARALVHPASGMIAINAAFFTWHVGPVYDASLRMPELYGVQQLTLLLASLLFWWPIVAPLGGRRVLSQWGTLGYILVATIPQTFGGITVALAKHPLYPTYAAAPRVLGLGVMTDQQISGACIALVSKLALFTAFAIIFTSMLNESSTDGDDDGGGGGWRGPGADIPSPRPSGSVPWLAELNAGRTVPEPAVSRGRIRVPAGAGPRRE
ncbi:MAG: cytochrome c oxidase assembly protein [Candidatus Dormibacter sp.]